jgi:beta-N-acetylhexosaminidase
MIRMNKPGALYVCGKTKEQIKKYTEYANSICKFPVLIVTDVENGPQSAGIKNLEVSAELPQPMAWGAADDERLVEMAGEATGKICRKSGIHIALSPVVDININKDNPLVNIRAISDSADQVSKMGRAYMRGMQKNGYLLATAKHFPGDGVDDRNQHFCATVNSLSREEWDRTFGKVYRDIIEEGVAAIMVAHIALPAYDEDNVDPIFGPLPGCLSYPLMTGLLREKLGFNGCIISDAMSMIGSSSRVPIRELAAKFIAAGGDMVLFPEKNDLRNLLDGYNKGIFTKERLMDAVGRILELKKRARAFEDEELVETEIDEEEASKELGEACEKIAEKSLKIVRDVNGALKEGLKPGDKVLMINLYMDPFKTVDDDNRQLLTLEKELRARGIEVDVYHRITHRDINKIKDKYTMIVVNSKISSKDYRGGDLRIGWWDGIMTFWRAYILDHPRVVFISFGDPYKIYELPFLKTYVNAFSNTESTQTAVAKLLAGEIEATGKNPVSLKGIFERETD